MQNIKDIHNAYMQTQCFIMGLPQMEVNKIWNGSILPCAHKSWTHTNHEHTQIQHTHNSEYNIKIWICMWEIKPKGKSLWRTVGIGNVVRLRKKIFVQTEKCLLLFRNHCVFTPTLIFTAVLCIMLLSLKMP